MKATKLNDEGVTTADVEVTEIEMDHPGVRAWAVDLEPLGGVDVGDFVEVELG